MKRNKFSLSHYKMFTCDMGYLIPITWFEAIPGDTFQHSVSMFLRLQPLIAPVIHPINVRIHHWFVPYRLIWDDFEDFITGGVDGLDATIAPYKAMNSVDWSGNESSLSDYLGIPPVDYTGSGINISVLPFRAYSLILNEFYRDQNLVSERTISKSSGSDSTSTLNLASVSWEKDYFTTSRDAPQLGADVTIPLTGDAPVLGFGKVNDTFTASTQGFRESDGQINDYDYWTYLNESSPTADSAYAVKGTASSGGYPDLSADLSSVSGVDINDLRLALATQRFQEARMRYGARYTEWLRYNGVRPGDARLQRPEYLGGGRQVVNMSEVLNHSDTDTGDYAGNGSAAMKTNRYRRFIPEHGLIMSLMSILPKPVYTQGLHRSFSKTTKYDYFTKEFQNIGDQEIYNKEVYVEAADPNDVFSYGPRYDDYKYMPSGIAGEFRSSLDHYHFARQFGSEPSLNSTFVTSVPRKDPLLSSGIDACRVVAMNSIQARRPMNRR